jgi:prepilin-type N-terminal cleavage/methylation domain-containing protein
MFIRVEKRFSSPGPPCFTCNGPSCSGFSLIEIIGVLTVLAILATAIFSATTKSIDIRVSRQETAVLQSFATALQNSILRNRYIPGTNDWYQRIADEMGVSTNAVLYNIRTPGSPRVLMIDPNISIGRAGGSLPYQQGVGGSVPPSTNCRVMIVASLVPQQLPAAGVAQANFAAVWDSTDGLLPSTGFAGWNPDDLKIQRVNLSPLFVNLSLANNQSGVTLGQYQIDGVPSPVPGANGTNAYFLKSTCLDLLSDVFSAGTTNTRLILDHDAAYFYAERVWRDVPYAPVVLQTNAPFASMAEKISASASIMALSPYNINAAVTPPMAVNAISNFMYYYVPYAAAASASNDWTGVPQYADAKTAQNNLTNVLTALYNNPVSGGCINPP